MWVLGDQIYMARVTPTIDAINDRAQWEFYAGGHGDGAKWVHGDVNQAVPMVEWTNHTGGSTMTYFKPLNKYVMTVQTASTYPVMDQGDFDTYFLESDSITGPWSYVTYMRNFGPQVYFGNHPSKFAAKAPDTAARTYDAFLMYSANYDPHTGGHNPPNSAYHMNLQQARFDLSAAFAAKLANTNNDDDDDICQGKRNCIGCVPGKECVSGLCLDCNNQRYYKACAAAGCG